MKNLIRFLALMAVTTSAFAFTWKCDRLIVNKSNSSWIFRAEPRTGTAVFSGKGNIRACDAGLVDGGKDNWPCIVIHPGAQVSVTYTSANRDPVLNGKNYQLIDGEMRIWDTTNQGTKPGRMKHFYYKAENSCKVYNDHWNESNTGGVNLNKPHNVDFEIWNYKW